MSEARDLLRSLAGDDEWIRHSTLQRLREEGFDGDLERLKEALDDDADATRRNAARMALAALAAPGTPGADGALGVLLDALRSPHPDLRTLAAVAAGEAGNRAATPSLIERLDDTDINVAAAAAEALGALKDADAIEPLVDVARAADGFWLRSAAVAALGRIQDVRGLPGIRAASAVPAMYRADYVETQFQC
ncbi:MAG TPA: HEAT repeat domain-containing protein [Longimicrobiales bacterium]|nr:HEAT repeat domain-containing protein [Longimicrobiales bacterium]